MRAVSRVRLGGLQEHCSGSLRALFSAQAAPADKGEFYNVPEGHQSSDLSDVACNIGLSRRKDLTLRQDIRLTVDGQPAPLAALLKGKKAVIFGVPDCGKVCSEQHLPGFVREWEALRAQGVTQILCVTVSEPVDAQKWATKLQVDPSKVTVAADANSALTRFLGVERGSPGSAGPRSMRYAALVEDGILLKLKIDKSPGEVAESCAESMVKLLQTMAACSKKN